MTADRSRESRLKAALRANLRRRKARARGQESDLRSGDPTQVEDARPGEGDSARCARMTGPASALAAKRAQIAALVALDFGHSGLEGLASAERAAIEQATAAIIERGNAVVADVSDPIAANVRLGRLLAEYRDLEQLGFDGTEVRFVDEGGREDDA